MRLLIDGYNLMHALGLMGRRFGPDGFQRARHRFLNDLAAALGATDSSRATVVFDAAEPPPGLPIASKHKGIAVVFAVDDDEADDRLEFLISKDSAPKGLTVVSSDRRVRRAAERRGAKSVSSDDFWSDLESRMKRPPKPDAPPKPAPANAEDWAAVFADVSIEETTLSPSGFHLTDEDLARIEKEEGASLNPRRLRKRVP